MKESYRDITGMPAAKPAHADNDQGRRHAGLASLTMAQRVAGERYPTIDVEFDASIGTYWCTMRPDGHLCFTPKLLEDFSTMQSSIRRLYHAYARPDQPHQMRYFVLRSALKNVYNFGGDLNLFVDLIRSGDREGLLRYGRACIRVLHTNATSIELPIVTVALVQGDALGGGFECALSFDVIIAERQAKFGFPEVLFNLFPGMGAYSFLSRRLDGNRAEKMILSGRLHTAEELYEMGLIDVLVDEGEGQSAVLDYISRNARRHNAHQAIYHARRRVNPLPFEELESVVELWVEAAMQLSESDMRKMLRLTAAQDRRRTGDTGSVNRPA
ncbi:crotonase/enoyl-CoA hydratase family protein [Hongsoonwoonella zoysiae]|uniref:crotonase/enoyl-CoA hydratase family protein n=1 Tax=Hongsoonwoonella zoysiae TaxID=2821844 RepID=UPI001AED9D3A|nr:crotonase/enoyl-CoA hydratase family protein [Hongsoonwoonella zoysiae]